MLAERIAVQRVEGGVGPVAPPGRGGGRAACEICGAGSGAGRSKCHDVWEYDDTAKVQRLERLWLAGLAYKLALSAVVQRLAAVNGWSEDDAL
jgi:hypothetical protein